MGILYIDGKPFKINELIKVPWDFDIAKNSRVVSNENEVYAWFGQLHVYSNMCYATIYINGVEYPTNEHFIQSEKCRLFKDTDLVMSILKCWNPFEVKKIAKKCENYNKEQWDAKAYEHIAGGFSVLH